MSRSRFARCTCARMVLTAVLLIASAAWGRAQTTSASVAGTVKDASGAVLPSAGVTLKSQSRGTEQKAVTDRLGNFFFPYVQPDTYALRVTLPGFQALQVTPLVVNAGDEVGTGTLTLKMGDVRELVTVSARAADLQLRSAERGFTLQRSELENMGVTGRNILGLAALVPGMPVVSDVQTMAAFSANGQRANSNTVTIDGVSNVDTGDNAGAMVQTNPDAIAEFKVLASNYQAEYGRAFGAQVHLVTKSGTQTFSGSAYWYGRRAGWDANTWWNNRSHLPIAQNTRNDQGYTIGGPVFLPGLFNAEKKKLFFFWSQEIQRRSEAPVNPKQVTVPTKLERVGDFSQSVDATGRPAVYIRDYTTGLPCSAANTSGCFADGGVLGRIPQNRLNTTSLAVLSLFPLPNMPAGTAGFNYQSQRPNVTAVNEQLLRTDYQVSDNWRASGRYMWNSSRAESPYGGLWVLGNVDRLGGITGGIQQIPARNYMISATGILSHTTSLEIQLGSAHNSIGIAGAPGSDLTRTGKGIRLPLFDPSAVQQDFIPSVSFGTSQAFGAGTAPSFITTLSDLAVANTTYDVVANFTKIVGSHALKAGGYYQRSTKTQSSSGSHNGSYSFASSASNPYDTNHPFANAAVGVYNTVGQGSARLLPDWQYANYEWYVQDNWRMGGRFTLDYGLRFYYLTPTWDVTGQASNFLPSSFSQSAAVRLFRPAVINGARVGYDGATGRTVDAKYIGRVVPGSGNQFQGSFQGGNGIDKTLSDGNKFRLAPRVGFAYDLTGKQALVARGAFGIFYDRPQGNTVYEEILNPPGLTMSSVTYGLVSNLENAEYYAPVNLSPTVYAWKVPTVYEWNVAVQAKLPAGFVLDIAYIGSESRDLLQRRPINALPYGATYLAGSQDPTRGTCKGCLPLSTIPGANALPADFLRPYQGYGNIQLWEFSGWANYKALQTSVVRRFSKGLMLNFQYARSKAWGISGTDWDAARSDGKDRQANYGPLPQNRPNLFLAGFVYRMPDIARGILGYATNGWQVSGTYRWMTGAPYGVGYLAVVGGVPLSGLNLTGSDQPARIVITGDTGRGYSSNPYVQFNTSAFQAPLPNSNGLESPRVYMVGPPINNLDLSLSKSFPLGGRRRLEIRLDAFNALNHTQFSGVNTTALYTTMGGKTVANLPYNAAGLLAQPTGFGTVNGVRPARQLQLMTRFSF